MRLFISTLLAISLASSCTSVDKPNSTSSGTTAPDSTSPDTKVQSNAPKTTVLKEFNEFKLPDEFSSFDTPTHADPGNQPTTAQSQRKARTKQMTKTERVAIYAEEASNDACAQLDKNTTYASAKGATNELIGYSANGEPLIVEHYGSYSGPQILVVGQVHGNECSPALFTNAVRELDPSSWGIYLVPTLNPDGLKTLERRASGVDLNRDGLALKSPEAKALMDFTASQDLFLTIHLHSPNGWVGYHGSDRAVGLAEELSNSMALDYLRSAGSGRGFLWEGQAKRVPGHQSVLVELPAVFSQEAPFAPERVQRNLEEVSRMVDRMTRAMLEYMNRESVTQLGVIDSPLG